MQVWTENDKAVVRCSFQEKENVKAIGDFKFNKSTATWIFPLRKLTDIIDTLNIQYNAETKAVYDNLVIEKQKYHAKVNAANELKKLTITNPDTKVDLSNLYEHQKKAFALASLFDSYALFMSPGTGKSLVAIKLIQHWQVPAMVVAPLSTLESVWVREIEKWSTLKCVVLWDNLKAYNKDYDVYIINYAQFKILQNKALTPIEKRVQCLVIEESSVMKNYSSGITKSILEYRNKIKHKLCLSGTPAPNNLLEYHSQMAFVNDALLGDNFFKFRSTYFFSTGFGGYLYKPMTGAKDAIIQNVSKQAFSIDKDECLDLPDKVYETRYVYMDKTQEAAYKQMKEENIMQFKEHTTLGANELAKLMKLRQITSGFTITTEGATVSISPTKINALKELLDEIPEDKQVIVWCNFHFEINRLKEEFKDQCCTLYGDMTQKEKNESITGFQQGKYRILLAHPLSGGLGLNLQNCSYICWYSLSYSSEQHLQANDRIYRQGQVNKCTYFYLIAKDTIDEIIYKVLDKKIDLIESCLSMLKG